MTHAGKRMNPRHFWIDPADSRVRINLQIRIQLLDRILALAEFALSEWSCCMLLLLYALHYFLSCISTPVDTDIASCRRQVVIVIVTRQLYNVNRDGNQSDDVAPS